MFKVGEKVRVTEKYKGEMYDEVVRSLAGEVVTISRCIKGLTDKYRIEEDDDERFYWTEDELEKVFNVGTKVKVVSKNKYPTTTSYIPLGHIGIITEIDEDGDALIDDRDNGWVNILDLELTDEEINYDIKVGDKVRIKDIDIEVVGFTPKYDVGDKIRIVDDSSVDFYHIGDVAEIISVDYDDEYLTYELEDDWVTEDDIELVENIDEFAIGDKVKIVNCIGAFNFNMGKLGVIIDTDHNSSLEYHVELEDGDREWVNNADLEFIDFIPKYKVGDEVRIKLDDYYNDTGMIMIVDTDDEDLTYSVELDAEDDDIWVREHEIILLKNENEHLKVGDKVKIIESYFAEPYFVGETAEILKVDTVDETYYVYIEASDCTDWVDYSDVELIKRKFYVGDEVKIVSRTGSETSTSQFEVGYIGEITEVGGYTGLDGSVVRLDNKALGWVDTEDLVLVDEEKLDVKVMTLEEIEEELGYKVSIVSSK